MADEWRVTTCDQPWVTDDAYRYACISDHKIVILLQVVNTCLLHSVKKHFQHKYNVLHYFGWHLYNYVNCIGGVMVHISSRLG